MRSDRGGVGRLREPASRGITETSAPPQAAGSRLRSLLILMAVARTEPASLDSQRRLAIAGQKARKSCAKEHL